MAKPAVSKPTSKQRITELQAQIATLHDIVVQLQRDFHQAATQATLMEDRANTAVEALEQIRTRAQALYDAIYRGKISRAEDILREMDPIAHS